MRSPGLNACEQLTAVKSGPVEVAIHAAKMGPARVQVKAAEAGCRANCGRIDFADPGTEFVVAR